MQDTDDTVVLTWRGIRSGIPDIAPVALYAVVLGIAFGAAAQQAGLTDVETTLMSAAVFSGAAQFVALDMGLDRAGLGALLLAVLAVNTRHVLLGAALHPWLRHLGPWRRFGTAALLSDANWAMAMSYRAQGGNDVGVLVGGGLALWVCWFTGTVAGLTATGALLDPERYGLDILMLAFFATVLVSMWRGRVNVLPWLAAAIVSLLGLWLLPTNWHIMAGALAGGVVGAALYRE
ncbi:MAG: AzlC family ABC transporter permease [Pseudomonadota bacterium]